MAVDWDAYVRGVEADLVELRNSVALLENGTLKLGSRESGGEWKDTTAETIAFDKKTIETYETILKDVRSRIAGKS